MRFGRPHRPAPPREAVVPMINVVFLLLIFFLMSAAVSAPDPVRVRLPEAVPREAQAGTAPALYLDASGTLFFGALTAEAALRAAARADGPLDLRADGEVPADRLAEVLAGLAAAGATGVRLITARR